jgi:putative sterol carrier protein
MAEKKYKYPSEKWIKAWREDLNKNKEYAEAAKDWEGDFLFVINSGGPIEKEIIYYVDLWHGKCREAYEVPSRDAKKTAFIYEGPYENWKKIIKGELDPTRALLTRQMKLTGDMAKVMRYVRATNEMVKTNLKIPTDFIY